MKLVLASQSPWRKKLLSWLEIPFEVEVSEVDEAVYEVDEPDALVASLAAAKAEAVAKRLDESQVFGGDEAERYLVIGADTVIVSEEVVLGKPKDRQAARETIQALVGKVHEVWTGVCVVDSASNERRVEVERTRVTFRHMSDEEVESYLKTEEWKGKAGAYQILGHMSEYLVDLQGSMTSVVGLPLITTRALLEEFGMGVGLELEQLLLEKIGYPS